MDKEKTFTFDQLLDGLGPIIFESIKIPFGIFHKDHRVLWANEGLASLHQVSLNKLIGNICFQTIHGRKEPCKECTIRTVFETGKIHIAEQWYIFPNGKKGWGEVHNYPIRGNNKDVAAVITFGFDVTDRKNRIEVLSNYSKYLSDKLNGKRAEKQKIRLNDDETAITVKLSQRESEILRLVTEGYTNVQIGSMLSITGNTARPTSAAYSTRWV
ncbi:MAG: PAS domain-containing protein [Deltaproteobacteria bacterium]|nr:PAS domain-containing protein [Deltaproteobacteria bacterium]